jgi:hypothetical protein
MEARQEVLQFPHGVRDDFVDALAWVGAGLGLVAPATTKRATKPEPVTGSLGWVKASSLAEKRERAAAFKQGW